MNDDETLVDLNAALANHEAHDARVAACEAISIALAAAGTYLYLSGVFREDAKTKGLTLVVEMAGELATGCGELYKAELWYAGSAMLRQLVETQYLLALFSADPTSAETWQNATPEELRKWWTPAAMRAKSQGRFQDQEYWQHCELGGHPVPAGARLLRNRDSRLDRRYLWLDLAHHLQRIWADVERCFFAFGYGGRLNEAAYEAARAALETWIRVDDAFRLFLTARDS